MTQNIYINDQTDFMETYIAFKGKTHSTNSLALKMSSAFILKFALNKVLLWKQTLCTLIRLLPWEKSNLCHSVWTRGADGFNTDADCLAVKNTEADYKRL